MTFSWAVLQHQREHRALARCRSPVRPASRECRGRGRRTGAVENASSVGKLVSPASTLRTAAVKALARGACPRSRRRRAPAHGPRSQAWPRRNGKMKRALGITVLNASMASKRYRRSARYRAARYRGRNPWFSSGSFLGTARRVDSDTGHHLREKCGGAERAIRDDHRPPTKSVQRSTCVIPV